MQSTIYTGVASFRGLLRQSRARRVESHKRRSSFLFLLLLIFSVACTPASYVTVAREMPTGFESGEAIGFLFSRQFSLHGVRVEESEIIGCISEAVRKAHPALRIVSPDEFRRVVFPDLPPEGAPNELEYLVMLLEHPTFKGVSLIMCCSVSLLVRIDLLRAPEKKRGADYAGVIPAKSTPHSALAHNGGYSQCALIVSLEDSAEVERKARKKFFHAVPPDVVRLDRRETFAILRAAV